MAKPKIKRKRPVSTNSDRIKVKLTPEQQKQLELVQYKQWGEFLEKNLEEQKAVSERLDALEKALKIDRSYDNARFTTLAETKNPKMNFWISVGTAAGVFFLMGASLKILSKVR